jgi:hypothetical protein
MSRENLEKLLEDTNKSVEELREADQQRDSDGCLRFTSRQTGTLIALTRDVIGVLNSNLDVIADAHGW